MREQKLHRSQFFEGKFFAEWHKIQIYYEMRIQSNEHKKEFANFCTQYTKCDCQKFEFIIDYIFYFLY